MESSPPTPRADVTPVSPVALPDADRDAAAIPATAPPAAPAASASPGAVWARVRQMVEGKNSAIALVESVRLHSIGGGAAVIGVRSAADLAQFKTRAEQFRAWIEQAVGAPVKVEFKVDDPSPDAPAPVVHDRAVEAALMREAEKHPLVRHAMDLFDARIVDIRKE